MIDKIAIQNFMADLEKNATFDEKSKLLWGFFFLDSNKKKLRDLSDELEKKGFKYVDIFDADMEDKSHIQEYYLHLEKIECYNIDSLLEVNLMLSEIADRCNIDSFDGFDVGLPAVRYKAD